MSATKAKPIIFSGPMVRAILEGRKTQTRRVCKPQPPNNTDYAILNEDKGSRKPHLWVSNSEGGEFSGFDPWFSSPYQPGDLLWVRETWKPTTSRTDHHRSYVRYRADDSRMDVDHSMGGVITDCWRSPIFMPRWASRITLRVEDTRLQRVQEITEEDSRAEGADPHTCPVGNIPAWQAEPYVYAYAQIWESINAKRGYGWDSNPWVWAYTFERVEQ